MESITHTLRRKRLVALNWTLTLAGVAASIFVFVVERTAPVDTGQLKVLFSVLLLVLTFQVTQIGQALLLDTKFGEFSASQAAMEQLGDDRALMEDLMQKITLVHQKHEMRWKSEGFPKNTRTSLRQQAILKERIHLLLKDAIRVADELLEGNFHTYFWSCRVLHHAVKEMERELIGLSPLSTTDMDWWTCPDGEEFLTINREAVASKKRVVRIFVYEPKHRQQLDSLLKHDKDAATEIYSIDVNTLAKHGFGQRHEAVAVVDRALMFGAETGALNKHYDRNTFSVRPDRINTQLAEFENILKIARRHHPDGMPSPATDTNGRHPHTGRNGEAKA